MIKIDLAAEPSQFDGRVRQPGKAFLGALSKGKKVNFRGREYWRRILDDIHEAYSGICAYTCHYVPLDTGADTVEHFDPKSLFPALAYEWTNYRFVSNRMNGRKGDHQDIVDPFLVSPGMFRIHFPSLQIQEGIGLPGATFRLAKSTILRLKLNQERNIRARLEYVTRFRDGKYSLSQLSDHAPFIHAELRRQGITRQRLRIIMPRMR